MVRNFKKDIRGLANSKMADEERNDWIACLQQFDFVGGPVVHADVQTSRAFRGKNGKKFMFEARRFRGTELLAPSQRQNPTVEYARTTPH